MYDPGSPVPPSSERDALARSELFGPLAAEVLDGLAGALRTVSLRPGEVLFREGDESEALYVVRHGRLRVTVAREGEDDLVVGEVGPREAVGEMQAVAGGRRMATVRAVAPTELVEVPREAFLRLEHASPEVVERIAETIRRRLRSNQFTQLLPRLLGPVGPELVEEVRAAGEWVRLRRGECLFRQGDPGDDLYLVVSGRLAAVAEDGAGAPRVLGEIPAGEPIGEMALFTGETRSASVYALRNSELVRFSKPTFERVVERHPHVMAEITRLLIGRLRRTIRPRAQQRREQTIALLPASPAVPLAAFARRLRDALHDAGNALLLASDRVDALLGVPRIAQLGHADAAYLRLTAWLDEQEAHHRFVLYQADPEPTPWTRQGLQRADHVLIVAEAGADPAPGPLEALLDAQDTVVAPRRTLVLLHPDGDRPPRQTRRWLDPRRVQHHHHVRLDRDGDVHRVARFLSDRAVGLVLSGGGARGFAHIGLLRALREHGVPIDMIGGTSMGAILGAQIGMERDWEAILRTSRATFVAPRPFRKYTLPLVSLLRHGVFDGSAVDTFGDADLEDLWVPCFCVATNLSTAESVVYRRGPATEATLASSALPGIVTPRVRGGHLLIDGGVLANTPTDVMQRFCSTIVVSDVTQGQVVEVDFDAFPSPWELLWRRLSPFHDEVRVPGLMSILTRAAVLGSIARDTLARDAADLYLRMPVEGFGMLEMDRIDEIVEAGYAHSRAVLERGRDEPWYPRVMATSAS
jgi:CRP-like cAMP-binding protein/predicted acylesterase/phospholipase RssA